MAGSSPTDVADAVASQAPLMPPTTAAGWYAIPTHEVLSRLETTERGLTSAEASERLARFGPNALKPPRPVSAWRILLNQFRSVVVLLLVAATLVAWMFGDAIEAMAVLAVLVINAALGFATELRARVAMAALLRLEVPRATVLRDGVPREMPAHGLVPGDVIVLEAGEAVPADARLLEAAELRTNESLLTGESLPVDKRAGAELPVETDLAERANTVFLSTTVVAGRARAVVVGTGMETEVGRIGGLVGEVPDEKTPLEVRLDALGRRLVWLTLAVAGVVIFVGLLRGEPTERIIETGIALAVAAVPEGLAAVSTIALAVGVARMARRRALVRRLPAVEALGSATTVCTDKTGTLTAGEMTVTEIWAGGRTFHVGGIGYSPKGDFAADEAAIDPAATPALALALRIGALANRAAYEPSGDGEVSIDGDPTEVALLAAAWKAGFERHDLLRQWPEVGEVPFSSERMWMATFHDDADGRVAYVKGAPARVLELSRCIVGPDGAVVPLDDALRERVREQNREMAGRGLRVLALAQGRVRPGMTGVSHDRPDFGLLLDGLDAEHSAQSTSGAEAPGHDSGERGQSGHEVHATEGLAPASADRFEDEDFPATVAGSAHADDPLARDDRSLTGHPAASDDPGLPELTLVGLVGMSDPPAAGVRETIDQLRCAGIRTIMITGDQRLTAHAVARNLGILHEGDEVVAGRELRDASPDERAERLARAAALCRTSPEDKLRIVEALQRGGQIVAMLGDGVNDAAALKKADIGVAMGHRGTDVAKDAAAVVLQDDRFQTIGAAVEEGRIIFDNIRKFVFYLFSCNLAEVVVILGAGLVGLPQPLLPLQILWLNLVTDTFPALSLAVEPGEGTVMRRPPRDPKEAILSLRFARTITWFAILITTATLAAFMLALNRTPADPDRAVTVAFMTLALAQTFHLGNARGPEPVLTWPRAMANHWAIVAVALVVGLQLLAVYLRPLAGLLDVVPLSLEDWLLVLPLALLPAVVGQVVALSRWRRAEVVPPSSS